LRVWNAATVFQPRSAKAARVAAGGSRCSVNWHQLHHVDGAADEPVALVHDLLHAGMSRVLGAEDRGDLERLVVGEDLLHVDHGHQGAVGVVQGRPLPDLERRLDVRIHRQRDRDRPEGAVGQLHVTADGLEVRLPDEALQRREGADGDHLEVAGLLGRELDAGQRGRLGDQRLAGIAGDETGDEGAAVGGDKMAHRVFHRVGLRGP
jgi:hypothetical protein